MNQTKVLPGVLVLFGLGCCVYTASLEAAAVVPDGPVLVPRVKAAGSVGGFPDPAPAILEAKSSETQKIRYLIDRIRQSPLSFIRNGREYSGGEAARHLRWKMSRSDGQVKTARQFIEHIATRSKLSGDLYMVRMGDGKYYPLRDVLEHELKVLE